jgi:hypothetical protein
MIGAEIFLLRATMAAYQGIGITRSLTYSRKRSISFSFPARWSSKNVRHKKEVSIMDVTSLNQVRNRPDLQIEPEAK